MKKNRLDSVNEHIQRELGALVVRHVELPPGVIFTIAQVVTSSDLSLAKVFVSILPFNRQAEILQFLERHRPLLQRELTRHFTTYRAPKIRFVDDVRGEHADHMNRLLDSLKDA